MTAVSVGCNLFGVFIRPAACVRGVPVLDTTRHRVVSSPFLEITGVNQGVNRGCEYKKSINVKLPTNKKNSCYYGINSVGLHNIIERPP